MAAREKFVASEYIRMALADIVRRVKAAGIGTPPCSVAIDVRDALVVWQPDGEVKTLRRKP